METGSCRFGNLTGTVTVFATMKRVRRRSPRPTSKVTAARGPATTSATHVVMVELSARRDPGREPAAARAFP